MQEQILTLADGRQTGILKMGNPSGKTVVYTHGFPASRLESLLLGEMAKKHSFQLIALDRPGYGKSDFKADRSILDWPADLEQILNISGIKEFYVLGVSGGAPYALSTALRMPDRVKAVSVVCGLGPVKEQELLDRMHWPARFALDSASKRPILNRFIYGQILGLLIQKHPKLTLSMLTYSMRDADRKTLRQADINNLICMALEEGLKQGTRGPLWDLYLYSTDWGFNLSDIKQIVEFWHGNDDSTVPVNHTEFMAKKIPTSITHVLPQEGHFSLPVGHAENIIASLLSH